MAGRTLANRTAWLASLSMVMFAANSVLCRQALGGGLIDSAPFAAVRVAAGAIALLLICAARRVSLSLRQGDWCAAAALAAYLVGFTFAYRTLTTGMGALILFGAVQVTMFAFAARAGERFTAGAWAGLLIAVAGFVYLLSPGLAAPDLAGVALMATAGIAWGGYTLRGRSVADPLAASAVNFLLATPPVLAAGVIAISLGDGAAWSPRGFVLATLSGAIASGCGYAIWYAAMRGLRATTAATIQLSVPVIAAVGGVVLLSEPMSGRLLIAGVATLGGIAIVLMQRNAAPKVASSDDAR